MSKIIWVGNRFFAPELKALGWDLLHLRLSPGEYFDWPSLKGKTGLDRDDVLVLADKSLSPALLGVEDYPCLTVFYSVDSHIHSWHPLYAQAFDLCLVSLKDNLPDFCGKRLNEEQCIWTPPCLLTEPVSPDEHMDAKEWDVLFVGTVDPAMNPERVFFMNKLKDSLPGFHYCRGEYLKLYPRAKLILNHSIAGDFNFRVMEALGCGSCLLTPRLGHGLEELFVDAQDLFLFDQEDIPALVRLVEKLLAAPDLCQAAARSGFNKVLGGHLAMHRAKDFSARLQRLKQSGTAHKMIQSRRNEAAHLHKNYLRFMYLLWAESMVAYPKLRSAYLAAGTKSDYKANSR